MLDAGVNVAEPVRPSTTSSSASRLQRTSITAYRLVGPICTPADVLYHHWRLPGLAPGHVLAIMDTGAYFVPFACALASATTSSATASRWSRRSTDATTSTSPTALGGEPGRHQSSRLPVQRPERQPVLRRRPGARGARRVSRRHQHDGGSEPEDAVRRRDQRVMRAAVLGRVVVPRRLRPQDGARRFRHLQHPARRPVHGAVAAIQSCCAASMAASARRRSSTSSTFPTRCAARCETSSPAFPTASAAAIQLRHDPVRVQQALLARAVHPEQLRLPVARRAEATNSASNSPLNSDPLEINYFQNVFPTVSNRQESTNWQGRLMGRYLFANEIGFAVNYRVQSGWQWARLMQVTLPNAGTQTFFRGGHQEQPVRDGVAARPACGQVVPLRPNTASWSWPTCSTR